MPTKDDSLKFPSGRTIRDCRKDAKSLRAEQGISLSAAQDIIASKNGFSGTWANALFDLKLTSLETKPVLQINPISRADIESVLLELPDLTHFGFGTFNRQGMTSKEYAENFQRDRCHYLVQKMNAIKRICT